MKKTLFLLTLALSACKPATAPTQDAAKGPAPGGAPAGGPPPPPPYQMRAELPSGDRLAGGGNGAALFSNRCGSCHLAGGMGTNLLTKQRMMAGQPPETGLLANRTDLTSDYVKGVVRGGKIAMPRLSRTEVTDGELDAIAAYLGKADK
jgi:mono/diheme cytochrome c family protein